MDIKDLIEGLISSKEAYEFAATIEGLKGQESNWLKALVGMANSEGGTLYVGVDPDSHEVLPFDHQTATRLIRKIRRLAKERVDPGLNCRIQEIEVHGADSPKFILGIAVDKSLDGPFALIDDGIPVFYVRRYDKIEAASFCEIRAMFLKNALKMDAAFTIDDFDEKDFTYLYGVYKRNRGRHLTLEELESIGFVSKGGKLSRGALLFKDDYVGDKALVVCSQFRGLTKRGDAFCFAKEIRGNLLKEYFDIIDFVAGRTADGFVKKDDHHETLISYPKRALAEAVANALVHRNYFINGSQIEVNLFSNRLEIVSPGSLLGSRWLKDEKDLSSIPPNRRNEVICSVFYMCKLMEKRGSGFDKIEEEYSPYGDEFAPFANSNNLYFSLTMFDLAEKNPSAAEDEFAKVDIAPMEVGSKCDLTILGYCFYKRRTVSQIASFLGIAPSSYFRKSVLGGLLSKGLLLPFKQGNAVAYTASKELVKLAD